MNISNSPISIVGSVANEVSPKTEIEAVRAQALLLTNPEELLILEGTALANVQALLGHGSDVGKWVTPRRWFPLAPEAKLNIDLRLRILNLMPDQSVRMNVSTPTGQCLIKQAVLILTRYLIVVRIGPAGAGRRGFNQPLDPSYIADLAYCHAAKLVAFALMRWLSRIGMVPTSTDGFMRVVHEDDFTILSANGRDYLLREARRMQILFDRGWWTELTGVASSQTKITDVAGEAAPVPKEHARDSHRPLPDAYVSEMGSKSLWLIESLAPSLLAVAERICTIWLETDDGARPTIVENRRQRKVAKLLESWEWKDTEGKLIGKPPFPIWLAGVTHKKASANADATSEHLNELSWPPRTLIDVLGLLGNVQFAHLFVVSLSTGGRRSETMDLRRSCVEYARDGLRYANGRTFKLVNRHDGELRDWVLPDLAVIAIAQQVQLVQVVERIGPQKPNRSTEHKSAETGIPDHLWVQVSGGAPSDRQKPLLNLDKAMRSFAKTLCMDPKPGNQQLRTHRFRKTIARLAALALAQAPKILMDVFGHKSIEMTLYYILCDKDLQADIEQVSRELRVMQAEEAVSAIVAAEDAGTKDVALGGYGGPAALMVQRAVQRHKERLHRRGEDWGAGSVRELAEILTLQGKVWEVVRHGVICTKLPGTEAGPCNKSKGRPEPSKCRTDCSHRLEEAFLREDVDSAIAYCIKEFSTAAEAQDELMQALWAGQIRAHVSRFSELRAKWSENPIVQQISADLAEVAKEAA